MRSLAVWRKMQILFPLEQPCQITSILENFMSNFQPCLRINHLENFQVKEHVYVGIFQPPLASYFCVLSCEVLVENAFLFAGNCKGKQGMKLHI
jgi:hypothetical protein